MVGGVCGVRGDVIPFGLANGQYASLEGLNIVGMKRRKFTRERLAHGSSVILSKLFHGPGIFAERLIEVQHNGGGRSCDRGNSGLHRRTASIARCAFSGRQRQPAMMTEVAGAMASEVSEIKALQISSADRADRGGRRIAVRGSRIH